MEDLIELWLTRGFRASTWRGSVAGCEEEVPPDMRDPAALAVLVASPSLVAGCDEGMSTVLVRNRTDQPLEVSRVPEQQLLARVNPGSDAAFRVSATVCERWTLEAAAPDGRTARRQPPNCDGVRWTVRERDLASG